MRVGFQAIAAGCIAIIAYSSGVDPVSGVAPALLTVLAALGAVSTANAAAEWVEGWEKQR